MGIYLRPVTYELENDICKIDSWVWLSLGAFGLGAGVRSARQVSSRL